MLRILENVVSKALSVPERMVDGVGMYRSVTLALGVLVSISVVSGAVGWLAYVPSAQLTSLGLVLVAVLSLNVVLAKLWSITANHESALITGLILFFLFIPDVDVMDNWPLVLAGVFAILSKYLLVYRKQHIVNPAAVGAVLVAACVPLYNVVMGTSYSSDLFQWWIANPTLFWPLVIVGSLVVFKIRRWPMVLACVGVGLAVFVVEGWWQFQSPVWDSVTLFLVSFPVLFLAFFMLTEPFTTPPTKRQQVTYGAIVGVLASTLMFAQVGVPMTPELALVVGNVFAYTFRIRQKLYLQLLEKKLIATDTWEFVFSKPAGFTFTPGQYLEWMLPHRLTDSRGLRRYFTIASSPTEDVVRLACKIMPEQGSRYKTELMNLDEGQSIIASQLSGDFLLPPDTSTKLGFVAGGIGVTPFSSHLSYMQHSGRTYDTALYYCANTFGELGYRSDFETMNLPLEVVPVIAKEDVAADDQAESGFITIDMFDRRTPDWRERTWYLSGPPGMVNAYYKLLRDAGLPRKQIKKDFFPGLA